MSRLLITGAAGTVGQALLDEIAAAGGGDGVVATDIRPPARMPDSASFEPLDVRGAEVEATIAGYRPQVVVHLASIVTPRKGSTRAFQHAVDVAGTRNVLEACIEHGVRRLVVTSSGAAYGYHADNPVPLTEDAAVRGNAEFAYAHHKRLVEEMLADARERAPRLEQVVLRVGTVLAPGLDNQITALFRRPRLLGVSGAQGRFVFIWARDLARILLRAAGDGPPGIYNVAGDGTLDTGQLAAALGKKAVLLPAWLLRAALAIAHPLGLTRYGPEQVRFLQFRPELDNSRLKQVFGYTPEMTSAEAFEAWRRSVGA